MTEKRPQQERSKFTVRSILEAADSLLDRSDDAKVTTRGIAERAGVSIGSLYQYFRGTDSILKELLRNRVALDSAAILGEFEAAAGLPVEDRLRRVFRKMLEMHLVNARTRSALFRRAPSLKLVEFARARIEEVAAELFRKLKTVGAIRADLDEELALYVTSRAVFSVVMSAVFDYEAMRGREDAVAGELAALVSRYVAPSA